MKSRMKLLVLAFFLAVLILVPLASGAQASTGNWACTVDPGHAPVGTTFSITCSGFTPNRIANIYAVEPDGRASGLNIYGFFPTSAKANESGVISFSFVTEFPALFSVPPGTYTFVVQELVPNGGGAVNVRAEIPINVDASPRPLLGATLAQVGSHQPDELDDIRDFLGTGYAPFEAVNIWVTQPDGAHCSGLGIDQLTLGALGAGSSSLWSGPNTVKADASGTIAFSIDFRVSSCTGVFGISARALSSGIGAETQIIFQGNFVTPTGAVVDVTPDNVPAFHSLHTVSGTGFPANVGINCWYTRPDGRVLAFINVNAKTDASGSFSVSNSLDDFPPFTSTEPGIWTVTCATPDRSALGTYQFLVFALTADP